MWLLLIGTQSLKMLFVKGRKWKIVFGQRDASQWVIMLRLIWSFRKVEENERMKLLCLLIATDFLSHERLYVMKEDGMIPKKKFSSILISYFFIFYVKSISNFYTVNKYSILSNNIYMSTLTDSHSLRNYVKLFNDFKFIKKIYIKFSKLPSF